MGEDQVDLPEPAIVDGPRAAITDEERAAGWRDLSEKAEEGEAVEGLLSNRRTTEAEWWGPVPEELWDGGGDGSGWAWVGTLDFNPDDSLIAWRPYRAMIRRRQALPPKTEGEGA